MEPFTTSTSVEIFAVQAEMHWSGAAEFDAKLLPEAYRGFFWTVPSGPIKLGTEARPMDTLSAAQRSERMARVKGQDTEPERLVRRIVTRLGYRYRLNAKDVPGRPDLVFKGRKKAIFVHGCFWHRHEGCSLARLPKSRLDFWGSKLEANRLRDQRTLARLGLEGWSVLVVWECQLGDEERIERRIAAFLAEG